MQKKKKKSDTEKILEIVEELKNIYTPSYSSDTIDLSTISSSSVGLPVTLSTDNTSITNDTNTSYTYDNKIAYNPYDGNIVDNWSLLEEKTKLIEEIENLKKYINELESVLTTREKFFDL